MKSFISITAKAFLKVCSITMIFVLSGCTGLPISTPFKKLDNRPLQDSFLIVVTSTEIHSDADSKSKFNSFVKAINRNLNSTPSLYGYSIRKELFGNKAWTYTIWNDANSVAQFTSSADHLPAMALAPKILKTARFARTSIRAEDLPYSWEQALVLLEKSGRNYNLQSSGRLQ
jgi:hypothetical protein